MAFKDMLINTFGVAGQKTRSEMAIKVGKELADLKSSMGGKLGKAEIESVFTENLPKRFRTRVLTNREEMIPFYEHTGYTHEQAVQLSKTPCAGLTLPDGIHKAPIYIPTENIDSSSVAHELIHALERNNTIKGKIARLLIPVLTQLMKGKNMEEITNLQQVPILIAEGSIRSEFCLLDNKALQEIVKTLNSRDDLLAIKNMTQEQYEAKIKKLLRLFVNPNTKNSKNMTRYKYLNAILEHEIPAYSGGGEVQRYAGTVKGDTNYSQTAVAIAYTDAKRILKQEKRLYLRNWLLGRLDKRPAMYQSEKDLYRFVSSEEEKALVKELTANMSDGGKRNFFWILKDKPEELPVVQAFLEKTKIDGKSAYINYTAWLKGLNPKALEDENFIKLALLKDGEYLRFETCISELSHATPEQITKILKIAQDFPDGQFCSLVHYLDNPNFDTLSKLATVKINNEYVYSGFIHYLNELSPEQLASLCKNAETVKNGNEAYELYLRIKDADNYKTVVKTALDKAKAEILLKKSKN